MIFKISVAAMLAGGLLLLGAAPVKASPLFDPPPTDPPPPQAPAKGLVSETVDVLTFTSALLFSPPDAPADPPAFPDLPPTAANPEPPAPPMQAETPAETSAASTPAETAPPPQARGHRVTPKAASSPFFSVVAQPVNAVVVGLSLLAAVFLGISSGSWAAFRQTRRFPAHRR